MLSRCSRRWCSLRWFGLRWYSSQLSESLILRRASLCPSSTHRRVFRTGRRVATPVAPRSGAIKCNQCNQVPIKCNLALRSGADSIADPSEFGARRPRIVGASELTAHPGSCNELLLQATGRWDAQIAGSLSLLARRETWMTSSHLREGREDRDCKQGGVGGIGAAQCKRVGDRGGTEQTSAAPVEHVHETQTELWP